MCREVIKFMQHETGKQFYFLVNRPAVIEIRVILDLYKYISSDLCETVRLENFEGVFACVWFNIEMTSDDQRSPFFRFS